MSKIVTATIAFCFVYACAARASEFADIIESKFRHAIVKIDVSSTTPVFTDGINICKSEGTGFVVSSSHVVTAEHVYTLSAECGQRNIVVKSKAHNLQKLATIVAAKDDVALLKVDSNFPAEMCALGLMKQDVYGTQAIRFGIPGGFDEPGPAVGVRIDQQGGQFSPLVLLAPTITEKGESGGPVVVLFNVVGLTRARHAQYPAFSVMTEGSTIRSLMAANSVRSGNICNPVEASMWNTADTATEPAWPTGSGCFTDQGMAVTCGPAGKVIASVKLDSRLISKESSVTSEMLNGFTTLSDRTFTVYRDSNLSGKSGLSIEGHVATYDDYGDVAGKVARTTDDISEQLREKLWRMYVAEGEQAGKWRNAIIAPPAPKK
jgi:hypothetical protein